MAGMTRARGRLGFAVGLSLLMGFFGASAAFAQQAPDGQFDDGLIQAGLCHRTGSADEPFVFIQVDHAAVHDHVAHGDILAARATQCVNAAAGQPGGGLVGGPAAEEAHAGGGVLTQVNPGAVMPVVGGGQFRTWLLQVGICHATGVDTEPWVYTKVHVTDLLTHLGHGDRVAISAEACATMGG